MNLSKRIKRFVKAHTQSKTLNFAFLLGFFGVVQSEVSNFQNLFSDPKMFSAFCIGLSLVVYWLRFKTTDSVMGKLDKKEITKVQESTCSADNPDA